MAPLYPQKLALNSPTKGGSSAGIVRSRSQTRSLFVFCLFVLSEQRLVVAVCHKQNQESMLRYFFVLRDGILKYWMLPQNLKLPGPPDARKSSTSGCKIWLLSCKRTGMRKRTCLTRWIVFYIVHY
jgi:hypothetical protein